MSFSAKQQEYLQKATHRWCFKTGATRSGKTWLDYAVVIPKRILRCTGDGLIVIIGNNKNSVERNVLTPMRNIWTPSLVGNIKQNDNTVQLFGKTCIVMGADKINQVPRIQGSGIEYGYGDEVATWNEEFFQMLKSRLDKPNSVFDGTNNPGPPGHWLKTFLDSDADIYHQTYQIDDNPFLTPDFIENLKKEYAGTVYYDRFILGLWKAAEGVIYRQFADQPQEYTIPPARMAEHLKDMEFASIGIDFGGTRSLTTFVASAIHQNFSKVTAVKDHHIKGGKGDIDADRVCTEFVGFVQRLRQQYPRLFIKYVWADSEAQYLINSLRKAIQMNGLGIEIGDSAKRPISERIIAGNTLLNAGRMFVSEECKLIAGGLSNALWDKNKADTRLDNFSTDIDIVDAWEYSWERFICKLCPTAIKER